MSLPEGLERDPQGMRAGDLVVARAWKYDGAAHWAVPGRYLGADRHGHWVFQPRGAFVSRPGHGFMAASDGVCLFPLAGDWVATFFDEAHPDAFRVYVDISTGLGWRPLRPAGWEVNSIDMDLDVCDVRGRAPFVDDEDEFADHARTMHYPNDLVRGSEEACRQVLDAVRNAAAPFDGSANAWFAAGRAVTPAHTSTGASAHPGALAHSGTDAPEHPGTGTPAQPGPGGTDIDATGEALG